VFLHSLGFTGHVVHYGAPVSRNVDAEFFMPCWDWYGYDKKRTGAHYAILVFLHPMGSVGQVVPSGTSTFSTLDALEFTS
jgi:hypothetical protein